ncbi:PilW family protein [Glaciimonas sp. PCH181]|uniref:PilW family protein n=1 Tax=Glaciimonas sp. PCH181 TaxID=2133943 RepID=UPI000D3D9843|nr:PilW family protein [Glaciimonas sp. PCH181]PUA16965.1 hypothetical protein C7W93_13410 [Glaciimonas sp. PCH181]
MLMQSRCSDKLTVHGHLRQSGITLIELLVSLLISFVLIAAVASLYLSSNASYQLNEDHLRLQQDGRYAMALMEGDLRQAGFGHLTAAGVSAAEIDRTDFVSAGGQAGQGLRSCDFGFVNPLNNKFNCKTGDGMAGFDVAYRVDNLAGTDCVGGKAGMIALPRSHPSYALSRQVAVVSNRFFVATPSGANTTSLYCKGNSGNDLSVGQPILSNIEDLRLTFGVAGNNSFSAQRFLSAAQVDALTSDQYQNWKNVIRVKLCLQLRGSHRGTAGQQRYTDCKGQEQVAADGYLHAVMTSVVTLRNNAGGGTF